MQSLDKDHLKKSSPIAVSHTLTGDNKRERIRKIKFNSAFDETDCDPLTQAANKLDYLWVARWLDDIGLPQFKEKFLAARVNGTVLHRLTVNDLVHLNVISKLHFCSIKRGIQVLRDQKFDANCLERRSVPEQGQTYDPSTIALWTSHRVMEWLRCVDLSEYTSSLRGSGVHGALIIHEPSFDADVLAHLLGIPSEKSLLRRYITTSFNNLIGPELAQIKSDHRSKNSSKLTSTKISIKTSRFNLLKRCIKPEFQADDLVCPIVNSSVIKAFPVNRQPNSAPNTPVRLANNTNGDHSD